MKKILFLILFFNFSLNCFHGEGAKKSLLTWAGYDESRHNSEVGTFRQTARIIEYLKTVILSVECPDCGLLCRNQNGLGVHAKRYHNKEGNRHNKLKCCSDVSK